MAHAAHAPAATHDSHEGHGTAHYVKVWALLLVLLVISIVGPMLGIRVLTLITAFGIAVVKAVIVAVYFMHLKVEKRYVTYMLISMLLMVALFFVAVMTDVMKPSGQHWDNVSAKEHIEYHKAHPKAAHGEHGSESASGEHSNEHK